MASLILPELKAEVSRAMTSVFDTFARDNSVTFYKVAAKTIVALDPNFNADFLENSLLSTVTYETQSQAFTCRINYLDRQDFDNTISGGDDLGVKGKFIYNRIKLQCKEDAFNYLKESERFEFLGELYHIEESWRRIGLLDTFQFYQVVLRRVS